MYGRNENLNKNAIENAIARKELVNKKGSSIGLLEEQTMEPDRFRVVTKGWIENSLFQRLFRRFGFENLYGLVSDELKLLNSLKFQFRISTMDIA